jgi:hypothetical protein
MAPLPHASPRALVGLGSLVVTVVALAATWAMPNAPLRMRSWPRAILIRFRADLAGSGPAAGAWVVVGLWSALVTALHFGGLALGVYSRLVWWDLLTHFMGGAGVAAALVLGLRDRTPVRATPWWAVGAAAAVGAGFEVYEFVLKDFWYRWSLQFYAVDTAVDVVVNTAGAVGSVLVVRIWRRVRVARPTRGRNRL